MKFSDAYGITRASADDWFDPILEADTKLFVDPFLVFQEKTSRWKDSHDEIISIFEQAFLLIAASNGKKDSLPYKKALSLLQFKEPAEMCLGYTNSGITGAGSGAGFGRLMAQAIEDAISRGIDNLSHFEELGILTGGIGADRVSDITCTIMKRELIAYTQDVATRHGVPMKQHEVYASTFEATRQRWQATAVDLPTNPDSGGAIVLVPERFLRDLPVLNAYDWFNDFQHAQLRDDLSYQILKNVPKKKIVEEAQKRLQEVSKWVADRSRQNASPYDLGVDPNGVYRWDEKTAQWVQANPLAFTEPTDRDGFIDFVNKVIAQFKLFVEEQGGWRLLWRNYANGEEIDEFAVQLLFRGIAQHYCRANNISLDGEVDLGRGPVDFKFSQGYKQRAHLEIKKVHNGSYWNGLEEQLPSYMKSDEVDLGWFMAVQYRSTKPMKARADGLPKRVEDVGTEKNIDLTGVVIDAREKKSASKLKAAPKPKPTPKPKSGN